MNRPRRIALVLAVSAALASSIAVADFDASIWKVRRSVGPSTQGGTAGFAIPADLYKGARGDLADLRLIADDGTEVMFDVWTDPPSERVTDIPAEKVRTKRGEEFRIVVLDTGETPTEHNRVTIKTLSKSFRRSVNVEGSRGEDLWENLRTETFLWSQVDGGRTVEGLHVDYPPTKNRFIRLSQAPEDELLAGVEGTVQRVSTHEGALDLVYEGPARTREDVQTKETNVTVDLGGPVPHNRLELVTTGARFHRWASAEESNDETTWRFLGAREIDRRALTAVASGPAEGRLAIDFPEASARFVRMRIRNYEQSPIPFTGMKVSALRREVRFQAEANKQYWLYYGNPDSSARGFTPKVVEGTAAIPSAGVVAIGHEEPNPGYGVQRSIWDQVPPFLLFGAAGAIAFLLLLVVIVIKKKRSAPKRPKDPDLDVKF